MDKDENVIQELRDLHLKVAKLEKVIEAKDKEASAAHILFDSVKYLLFGVLIIGPVVAIGWGVFLVVSSWIG